MAYFTTRVVLHGWATAEDYSVLHTAMHKAGFASTVSAADGFTYHMPPAEYLLVGVYKLTDVLGWAEAAASQTGKRDSVLVTEGLTLTWHGLKRIT